MNINDVGRRQKGETLSERRDYVDEITTKAFSSADYVSEEIGIANYLFAAQRESSQLIVSFADKKKGK